MDTYQSLIFSKIYPTVFIEGHGVKIHLDQHIISVREDYIREEDDEDVFSFKPEWKILPSILFVEGKFLCVLTCYEHNGGTELFMGHPFRWKHNFPEKMPDQICQAVIQPLLLISV